jgi:hypothetical protein
MLEALLEGLVSPPLIERQTLDQALAEHRMRESAPMSSGLSPEEERRLIQTQLRLEAACERALAIGAHSCRASPKIWRWPAPTVAIPSSWQPSAGSSCSFSTIGAWHQ